jgi:spermidine/putrescine transport system substrate-binding protein
MSGTERALRYLQFDALTGSGLLEPYPGTVEPVTRVSEMADIAAFRRGSLQVDVMAVFSPYVQHYTLPLGVLMPLDVTRLPHWVDLEPMWRAAAPFVVDGVTVAVPNNWGTDSLIVREDVCGPAGQDTLDLLFDPAAGVRVAMPGQDGIETAAVAGQYLGVANPFAPSPEELRAIGDLLRRQRSRVVRYWETERELVDAFAAGEVDVAWGWLPTCVELRRTGVPVRWARLPHGQILWADGNGIACTTENLDRAYQFMDFLLSPEYLYPLFQHTGYRTCSAPVTGLLTAAERAELELDDPAALIARCIPWVSPPPALSARIETTWREAAGLPSR